MRNNMSVEPGALENLMRLESGAYLLPVTALTFPPAVGRALAGRADLHLHARSATVGADLFCHSGLESCHNAVRRKVLTVLNSSFSPPSRRWGTGVLGSVCRRRRRVPAGCAVTHQP